MAEYMYGVRKDGSVVSIYDIDDMEFGKRCGCKCPQCHRALQACALSEQSKKSRYFRHDYEGYNREGVNSLNGCTATSANESGLHMMAKELIAETRKIAFPAMTTNVMRLGLQYDGDIMTRLQQNNSSEISLAPEMIFDCNEVVEVEKPYHRFRPDVSVSGNGQTFLIEIAVTHKVDADKQKRVEDYGIPMLEIDLSQYVDAGISREELRKLLSESVKHKSWICFPRDRINGVRQFFIEKAQRLIREKEEVEKQRAALAKQREDCLSPSNYASTLRANRYDYGFEEYAKREFHFEVTRGNYPFFIDIPISGETVFMCDRRIWQGKIFDRWVYFRKDRDAGPPSINISMIWDELTKRHNLPFNSLLNGTFVYPGDDALAHLPTSVIRKYLQYLEGLGFISIERGYAAVLKKHCLTPPNGEYATQLQEILRQVDGFSPSVSMMIGKKRVEYIRAEWERKIEIQRKEEEDRRKSEEAERRAAIEAEEKRRQEKEEAAERRRIEEAAKQAAEDAIRRAEDAIRQEMQSVNYDQNDYIVHDCKGRRWIKCKRCQKAVLFNTELSSFDTTAKNKGTCRNCRFRL